MIKKTKRMSNSKRWNFTHFFTMATSTEIHHDATFINLCTTRVSFASRSGSPNAYLGREVEACYVNRSFRVTLGALNVQLEEREAVMRPHSAMASVREAEREREVPVPFSLAPSSGAPRRRAPAPAGRSEPGP